MFETEKSFDILFFILFENYVKIRNNPLELSRPFSLSQKLNRSLRLKFLWSHKKYVVQIFWDNKPVILIDAVHATVHAITNQLIEDHCAYNNQEMWSVWPHRRSIRHGVLRSPFKILNLLVHMEKDHAIALNKSYENLALILYLLFLRHIFNFLKIIVMQPNNDSSFYLWNKLFEIL